MCYFSLSLQCPLKLKLLKFGDVQFVIYFVTYAFGVICTNPLPNPVPGIFTSEFSSMGFILLVLKFRPFIHSELIFVYIVREEFFFHFSCRYSLVLETFVGKSTFSFI